ncbi:hypothetical protein [Paraburkholderia sp. CI3]|uniref:hypothetical protein n=1 Tax=Paraburkholderia sp. CI3 TaxID=2991060 RepID=UPI003D207427
MFKKTLIVSAVLAFSSMSAFAGHMGGGMSHMGSSMGHMESTGGMSGMGSSEHMGGMGSSEHMGSMSSGEHISNNNGYSAGMRAPASLNHDFTTHLSGTGRGTGMTHEHQAMHDNDRHGAHDSMTKASYDHSNSSSKNTRVNQDRDDIKHTSYRDSSGTRSTTMSGSTQAGLTPPNPNATHGIRGPVTTAPAMAQSGLTPPNPQAMHGIRGPVTTAPAMAQSGLTPPNPQAMHGIRGPVTTGPLVTPPATPATTQPIQAQRSPVHLS